MNLLSIAIRPFVAVALFFAASYLAHHILKRLKPGPLKTLLSRRMAIIPRTLADRRDWWPVIAIFGFTFLLFAAIWAADPMPH